MANYSLVANSTFQPFTYQELAVPLDRQDAYHENLMQQYEQLSDKADILEAMGANDRDRGSKVYGQYKAYSDALRAEADNLYRHGLDTESRLRLTELRRRYNQEIVPIQNAWNKREQEAEMQMKAQMANPNLRFTRDARSSTLDDYIANPTGGYGVVNLNTITAQMAGMAKNLAKQIQSGAIKKENIDEFTYNIISKHGLDPNFINDWLQHPEKSPTLTNMMNQVLQSNGVTLESLRGSQNGESILRDATSAAQMGAWEAVGDDSAQMTPNWRARQDYEFSQQMAAKQVEAQLKAQLEALKAGAAGAGGAESVISTSEYDLPMQGADFSNARDMENAMKTLGYQMKNGKLSPTGKVNINGREASIFGNDGRVMNRRQFVAQAGSSEKDKKKFGEYFDKMVDAGKTLGIYGTLYNQRELSNHYNEMRKNSAGGSARVYALNYEKGDWNTNSKNYPIREIKNYRGGKPVFDTKQLTLNDILNRKDKNKNDVNVSAYWSNTAGNEGIILATTEDGKNHRYFIDASNMPENNIREARRLFADAEKLKKSKDPSDRAAARVKIESAIMALHTGLTIHNTAYDQKEVRQPSLKQEGLTE